MSRMFTFRMRVRRWRNLTLFVAILGLLSGCIRIDCYTRQITNPWHLFLLNLTNRCRGCSLFAADLSGAKLAGANLARAFS